MSHPSVDKCVLCMYHTFIHTYVCMYGSIQCRCFTHQFPDSPTFSMSPLTHTYMHICMHISACAYAGICVCQLCIYTCVRICMYTCVHMCMHICIRGMHVYLCTYMQGISSVSCSSRYAYMHEYVHVCVNVCIPECMHVCLCILECVHVCVYVFGMHACIHVLCSKYTHMHP